MAFYPLMISTQRKLRLVNSNEIHQEDFLVVGVVEEEVVGVELDKIISLTLDIDDNLAIFR